MRTSNGSEGVLKTAVAVLFVLAALACVAPGASAQPYTCTASGKGDWHAASTWTDCNSGVPGANDTARIQGSNAEVTISRGSTVSVFFLGLYDSSHLINNGSSPLSPTPHHTPLSSLRFKAEVLCPIQARSR
jgi:hypothetical protein